MRRCCSGVGNHGNESSIVRHLDLSTPAFTEIALAEAGVVDVQFQVVPCPSDDVLHGPDGSGGLWTSWQNFAKTTIQEFTTNRAGATTVLADIESAPPSPPGCGGGSTESAAAPAPAPSPSRPDYTRDRTGEIPISGGFTTMGGANATGHTLST